MIHFLLVDVDIELAKQAGAKKAMPLAVSVPCHSDLMKSASEELASSLNQTEIKTPTIPVINNVDAAIELNADAIRQKLITQLYSPVLWVASINQMVGMGITQTVECGPGKVLQGLVKKIESTAEARSI